MRTDWTREKIARAATLKREGMSFAQLAEYFGVSRSAMTGLANRNRDLFEKSKNAAGGRPRKDRGKTVPVEAPRRLVAKERPVARVEPVVRQVEPAWPEGASGDLSRYRLPAVVPKTTLSVGAGECRFPVSAFDAPDDAAMPLCGAEVVEGKSWCPAHCRVVYRPREGRAA
ncbi:GcrA family cell cycle regulator [Martelella sp. FOR1707]